MGLLRHYLRNELEELRKNGARLRVIGDRDGLAPDIVRDIVRRREHDARQQPHRREYLHQLRRARRDRAGRRSLAAAGRGR